MATKLIITLEHNLTRKYGVHLNDIKRELVRLAESLPGIRGQVVYLDRQESISPFGLQPITPPFTEQNCKEQIDALFKVTKPDYLVIFGSQDVFPFQFLHNPMFHGDEDEFVPSDLPYASDQPFSKNARDFIEITRVIGRVPDVFNEPNVDYVKRVVNTAITHVSKPASEYKNFFAVSAGDWVRSTGNSLQAIFQNDHGMNLVPPTLRPYQTNQVASLSHFINCHGYPELPAYFGQEGQHFPEALAPADISNRLQPGTIVAAECCYGAQLHKTTQNNRQSMANTYLGNNAVAFMGSSTISYGPNKENDLADLICQFFFIRILQGESTGGAMLAAKHDYIFKKSPQLSPADLKTLAQFHLIGDPAIRPVTSGEHLLHGIIYRRQINFSRGKMLASLVLPIHETTMHDTTNSERLKAIVIAEGFDPHTEKIFIVDGDNAAYGIRESIRNNPIAFRLFFKPTKTTPSGTSSPVQGMDVLQIKEDSFSILSQTIYHSR